MIVTSETPTALKRRGEENIYKTSHVYHTITDISSFPIDKTTLNNLVPDEFLPTVIYEDGVLSIGEYVDGETNVYLDKDHAKRYTLFSSVDYDDDMPVIRGEDINYILSLLDSHPKKVVINHPDIEDLSFHKIKFSLEIKDLTRISDTCGLYPTIEITDSEIPELIIDRCIGMHVHIEKCKFGLVAFKYKDTKISFNMFDSVVDAIDFTGGFVEFIRTRVDNSIIKKFIYEPEYNQGEVLNSHREAIWRVGTYSDVESINIDYLKIIKCNCKIECCS